MIDLEAIARFEQSCAKWAEWRAAMDELDDAIRPLVDLVTRMPSGVRIVRIRLSPFDFRRLDALLTRKNRIAEERGWEPVLPPGTPLRPSLFGIPIEEAINARS